MKLNGTWSQPGGDKKVFTGKDVSIIWRKNKNLMEFEGVKANQLKKEVCRLMCDYPSKSSDASVEFENLKHGQLLNGKAIQELLDTVRRIDAVISQFQDFMEKNRSNCEEKSSLREKSHAAIAKEMRCCDANDIDGDKSTNSEQLETITIADWDYSLASNATIVPCIVEPTGNNKCMQNSFEKSQIIISISDDELTQVKGTGCDNTYAEVASHQPSPAKNSQRMVSMHDQVAVLQFYVQRIGKLTNLITTTQFLSAYGAKSKSKKKISTMLQQFIIRGIQLTWNQIYWTI